MASINLKNKSKADLVAIVRMSGIMPISRAQRMTKAELISQLEVLDGENAEKSSGFADPATQTTEEEVLLQSAPGRLSARKLSEDKKTSRPAAGAERRSVFVAPDANQKDESKSIRRSVMAPVSTEEAESVTKVPVNGRRTRSAMMPVAAEAEQTEIAETAVAENSSLTVSEPLRTEENTKKSRKAAAKISGKTSKKTVESAESAEEAAESPVEATKAEALTPEVSVKDSESIAEKEAPGVETTEKNTRTRRKSPANKRKDLQSSVEEVKTPAEALEANVAATDEAEKKEAGEVNEAESESGKTGRKRTTSRRTKSSANKESKKTEDKAEQTSESKTRVQRDSSEVKTAESVTESEKADARADGPTAVEAAENTADSGETKSESVASEEKSARDGKRNQRNHNRNQLKRQKNNRSGHYISGHKNEDEDKKSESKEERTSESASETAEISADQATVSETGESVATKEKSERPSFDSGEIVSGVMEIMPDGYGFLRRDNYLQGPKDIYIPPQFIRRFNLREGDLITGPTRIQREQDRYQALYFIKSVNGVPPEQVVRRPHFDRLTPIYPNVRYKLETTKRELSTRIIDLIAPIGKGQRGMIVSPPKAGKTILLQKIANAISINNPEAKLIVLLIDERPEEVTDMQRSIQGEVVYSTFDKTPENHVKITELVLERAERLVEMGQDVVILMDSLTRMARAYNLTINPTGRTLSGGLDPGALYGPKRFFGAARNIENGGSLTIVATALIDTGSRMDEVIFEEFKGTGNMEVYLDRKLSEKRIFPAIDINRSGTRREELLLSEQELEAIWSIRKAFGQLDSSNVTETIMNLLMKTNDNQHFVSSINVSLNNKSLYDTMKTNGNKNDNR